MLFCPIQAVRLPAPHIPWGCAAELPAALAEESRATLAASLLRIFLSAPAVLPAALLHRQMRRSAHPEPQRFLPPLQQLAVLRPHNSAAAAEAGWQAIPAQFFLWTPTYSVHA